ncbi:MAG TPA: DUF1254 domain-containing protein, partial [Ktedonobacterales bacterium]|nr:DUF1254 domain-containing protein [Ktedonobacterales bacterium]
AARWRRVARQRAVGAHANILTKQIVSPNNTVFVIGRTIVESDSDLATAYGLAKQIQATPLSQWRPGH